MDGGFREFLAGLGRREAAALLAVGLVVAGGAVLWYVRSLPRPVQTVESAGTPLPGPSPSPAVIIVHVAGWVRSPGVYEMREGDRVIDSIERAGGPRRGADLDGLNLATLLADAQQVLVPRRVGPRGASAGSVPASAGAKININTATPEELEELPGIGPVLAAAIVEYREGNGPFASVEELVEVSGIGEKRLEDLRDEVTV